MKGMSRWCGRDDRREFRGVCSCLWRLLANGNLSNENFYLYSHRVFGIRLLQKCRPVCQYYEKYQMYDGVNIKGGKQPMVTGWLIGLT